MREKLSDLIQRRLKDLELSKAELSKLLGVSRSYIVNMANATAPTKSGQYEPSTEIVEKLAKHLQISQDEILNAIGYETNVNALPEPLKVSDFDGFDKDDLKEISAYIQFKKSQKPQ